MLTAAELTGQSVSMPMPGARRVRLMDTDPLDRKVAPAPIAAPAPIKREETAMPKGVYVRKPKGEQAPKKGAPPVAKKARGQYSGVLAELREKREQIDAAIAAIEALA